MKILIADDEHIIRFGLKLMLKSLWLQAEIEEAESVDGVVKLLAHRHFDLVILDIQMPGSIGLESLVKFMLTESKVIVFSSCEPTNIRIESLREAGVTDFIFKSTSIEGIKKTLSTYFI